MSVLSAIVLFSPGLPEILVIAGVIVLIFGASKIPQLGKGLGEGIRNFKQGLKGDEPPATSGSDKPVAAAPSEQKDDGASDGQA